MNNSREDCYRVLGVPVDASSSEIKRAYRDLVRVWHPDRFEDDSRLREKANEMLKAINAAYDTAMSNLDRHQTVDPSSDQNRGAEPRSDTSNTPGETFGGMGQFDSSKVIAVPVGEDSSTGFPLWRTSPFFREETSKYCSRRLATIREFPFISDMQGKPYKGFARIVDREIGVSIEHADLSTPWIILSVLYLRDVLTRSNYSGNREICSKALAVCGLNPSDRILSHGYLAAERLLADEIARVSVERVLKKPNRTGLFAWCSNVASNVRARQADRGDLADYVSVLSISLLHDQPHTPPS